LLLVVVSAVSAGQVVAQQVGVSANVGWSSDYLYRGITQTTSSASAGLDAAVGPFFLGTWAADVDDGSEVDVYGGIAWERGALRLSAGGTGYFYTGEFDDTYAEGNLGAGYGPFSVDFALGSYFTEPDRLDYAFLQLTAEVRGAYVTGGTFQQDFAGEYLEIGYGFTVAEVDLTLAWVLSDAQLAQLPSGRSDQTLVLSVAKSFTLR